MAVHIIGKDPVPEKYGCIVADPPWPEHGGGRVKRGADRHYPLMSILDIEALGLWIRQTVAADNAHLYLWVTNNYLPAGIGVMMNWGFSYITTLTWLKQGKPGLGQYFRGVTEHCLFGRRGQPPYRTRPDGKRAQGLTGFTAPRGKHSEKPVQVQEWAELVSPGPYIELFARSERKNWASWGLEAPPSTVVTPGA